MKQIGLYVVLGSLLTCSCVSDEPMPLVFGQSHILGISVQTGASGQAPDFTLGYKSFDLAIVPVAVKSPPGDGSAKNTQIKASMNHSGTDSLSVLGQFQANTSSSGGNVALGEFFATGVAAQALAVGFGTQLCNSSSPGNSSGGGGSSGSGGSSSGASHAASAQDCGTVFSNLTAAIGGASSSSSSGSGSSSGSSGSQ